MKQFYTRLPLLLIILLVSSCGDTNSYSVTIKNGAPVVVGSTNGLMWQMEDENDYRTAFHKMDYGQAKTFCQNLEYAGYTDWRMPTLDEMRSIIDGYSDIASGGRCKVSESCPTLSCSQAGESGDKDPCANNNGNPAEGPGPGGCFWSEAWGEKYCDSFWTATDVLSGDDSMTWLIDYHTPAIFHAVKASTTTQAFVRCVRETD